VLMAPVKRSRLEAVSCEWLVQKAILRAGRCVGVGVVDEWVGVRMHSCTCASKLCLSMHLQFCCELSSHSILGLNKEIQMFRAACSEADVIVCFVSYVFMRSVSGQGLRATT
jgi:hypothetical protein